MNTKHDSHRRTIGDKPMHPESLMMGYGYRPELSEGAIKPPLFMTSTFVFKTAEEGKAFFELAYGLRKGAPDEEIGLIYSRLNNPDLEILEDRLTLWDDAEAAAVFESGMAAISTTLLTFLKPGDVILFSEPIYGGTDYLLKHILPRFGIRPVGVLAHGGTAAFEQAVLDRSIRAHRLQVNALQLEGLKPQAAALLQRYAQQLADQSLHGVVLHQLQDKDLAPIDALGLQPESINVTPRGLLVRFGPKPLS